MGFYKDVHKGDKFTPNYQRENDINRMLNTFSGFSTPPRMKQSGGGEVESSGLKFTVTEQNINGVDYWKINTEDIYIQHRRGVANEQFMQLYVPKYTESATGQYASLILYPKYKNSVALVDYAVCYYLRSHSGIPALTETLGEDCVPCKSEYGIMLNKPIAYLGLLDTVTGEISNNYSDINFIDMYYHGEYEVAIVNSADGFKTMVKSGSVYYGSNIKSTPLTYLDNASYDTTPLVILQAEWDGEVLTCSIVNSYTEDTYTANIVINEWGEYPNGINIVGRVMP